MTAPSIAHTRIVLCIAATLLSAHCMLVTGGEPVPEGENWAIYTTIQPRRQFAYTTAPRTGVAGYFMWNNEGWGGVDTSTFNTKTDDRGIWLAGDKRYNARWHLMWMTGTCQTKAIEVPIVFRKWVNFKCGYNSGVSTGYAPSSYDFVDAVDSDLLDDYYDISQDLPPIPGRWDEGTLMAGGRLEPGEESEQIWSANGEFRLIYQNDGNLVIYRGSGWNDPIWGSDTAGTSPGEAKMQSDGNFVIYDSSGQPVWSTGTHGFDGAYLALLNDGSLVILGSDGAALWWSGTSTWIS